MQEMAESKAFLTLPSFQSRVAQFRFNVGVEIEGTEEGAATNWPKTVQYLILIYTIGPLIWAGLQNLRGTRLLPTEDERTDATSLKHANDFLKE